MGHSRASIWANQKYRNHTRAPRGETLLHPGGFVHDWPTRELHTRVVARHHLTTDDYRLSQLRYDLSKLRAKGLVERIGKTRRYCLTPLGLKLGVLLVKLRMRLLGPLSSLIQLNQVCERWIYSACLCFALDIQEQERTRFHYAYSIYQVEYSRNLLFHAGQPDGGGLSAHGRPNPCPTGRASGEDTVRHEAAPQVALETSTRLEVVLETPAYDLTVFKLHFGKLTLKAYTKGEHVLRFEVVLHNTQETGLRPRAGTLPTHRRALDLHPGALPDDARLRRCCVHQ